MRKLSQVVMPIWYTYINVMYCISCTGVYFMYCVFSGFSSAAVLWISLNQFQTKNTTLNVHTIIVNKISGGRTKMWGYKIMMSHYNYCLLFFVLFKVCFHHFLMTMIRFCCAQLSRKCSICPFLGKFSTWHELIILKDGQGYLWNFKQLRKIMNQINIEIQQTKIRMKWMFFQERFHGVSSTYSKIAASLSLTLESQRNDMQLVDSTLISSIIWQIYMRHYQKSNIQHNM